MMNYKLRPWHMNDLDSLVENANNANIAKNMTDGFPFPYTTEKGVSFITYAANAIPINVFAIEAGGKAVGGIGIHPQADIMCKNAELGYWLGEVYWGNGIITGAIREMVDYAFATFDIVRIYARTFGSNLASQKVLEKTGFTLEARISQNIYKLGEYQDELIYAIRRQEIDLGK